MTSPRIPHMDCTAFEARLGEYLEGALDDGQRAAMEAHRATCERCAALVADLDVIVTGAGALPTLSPSRDLWPDIEARINTPVVALGAQAWPSRLRSVSLRAFAAAAVLLVVASSGITWMLARSIAPTPSVAVSSGPQATPTPAVTPQVAAAPGASSAAGGDSTPVASNATSSGARAGVATVAANGASTSPARTATVDGMGALQSRTRLASRGNDDVGLIYEREIRSMRRIVDERLGDLDSLTVAEVERNLAIIDRAIADSRRALARDPRSRFLSTQLDRALENKLAIMRRVALL